MRRFLLPGCREYAGGKDEKEQIASLGVPFGRLSLTRMCDDSWHGGRYTEHRKSGEKDSLWRIGANMLPPCVDDSQLLLSSVTSGFAGTLTAFCQSTRPALTSPPRLPPTFR